MLQKEFSPEKTSASNVAVDSTAQVIKDVGYEAMRAGLNVTLDAATTMVPGANMIKSLGLAGIAFILLQQAFVQA